MNDIIDIEIILKKQNYHYIYNIGIILLIMLVIFLYISFVYNYKTYYITKGTMIDGCIKLIVDVDDIKYITKKNNIIIDKKNYSYNIKEISEEIYIDENFNNYKYIYIKVDDLYNINNYVYELKILKENKKIIEYIKEYI